MKVTTISGKEVDANKARLIQGDYYIIGDPEVEGSGECYKIGDRFYRDSSYIAYDHTLKRYVLSTINLKEGIVDISPSGKFTIGKFSNCVYTNNNLYLIDHIGQRHHLLNEEIATKNKRFLLDPKTGNYYHHTMISVDELDKKSLVSGEYKSELHYSTCDILNDSISFYNKCNIKNSWRKVPSIIKSMSDYMDNELTFGLEFETTKGVIPTRKILRHGLIPLRDGSVSGLEYATIPLRGSDGLLTLYNILEDLETYTDYDKSCSLHIHIGGIPRTEKFCLAMFKTMVYLQDKFFKMFPVYKKYNYGVKRKLYTAPLPVQLLYEQDPIITDKNVSENFGRLFEYLTGGISYSEFDHDLDNVHNHPRDINNNRKWQINTRYLFFNIVPLIFTNHETVEFRIHTPTYDKSKVFNYLGLCLSIVDFVKKHQNMILESPMFCRNNINIGSILRNSLFKNSSVLRNEIDNYVQNRVNYSYKRASKGDINYDESEFRYMSDYWPPKRVYRNITIENSPSDRGLIRKVRRNNILDDAVRGIDTNNTSDLIGRDINITHGTNPDNIRLFYDNEGTGSDMREVLSGIETRTVVIRNNEAEENQTDRILP